MAKSLALNYTHRKIGKLSLEQEQAVNEQARSDGFDSQTQAAQCIVGQFGVRMSATSVSRLFARLSVTAKVPRPQNHKTSAVTQAEYQRNLHIA